MFNQNLGSSLRKYVLPATTVGLACTVLPASGQIEEVLVTAQKRTESIEDIGIAVTAISGDQLQEKAITQPRDLFLRLPNLTLGSNNTAGQLQFSMRGVNFLSFSPISVQPILVFVDDVVINSPQSAGLTLYDLERVEVLRGPQNTLYGRNTTGGAINITTRRPEVGGEAGGYLDASIGNYSTWGMNAAYGAPIGASAAFRIALHSFNTDGMWDNVAIPGDTVGERNQTMLRAQFAVEPSEDVDFRFSVHGGFSDGGQRGLKAHGMLADAATGAPCTQIDIDEFRSPCVDLFDNPTLSANDEISSEIEDDKDDIDLFGASFTANWALDGATLTSITAFESNQYDHWEDADGIPVPFVLFRQYAETDQWSQEFRLTSNGSGRLNWMAGLFAMWETVQFETSIPIALFDREAAFTDSNNVDHDTTLYSPFLRLDYQVSEQWKLIAGLRYSNEEKEGDVRYQFSVGLDSLDIDNADAFRWDSLAGLRVPGTFIEGEFDESWDLWGGKLGVEFAPYDQALYYAHVSQGEKAGQYTDAPDAIANGGFFTPADPETVVAYEAGAKLGWLDRRLLTNVAVYFNDYEGQHQQITYPDPDTPGNLISTVVNVADSETWGVEFDMQYAPGNGWMLSASAAYLDTETKADSLGELTGGVVAVPVGRELTNAPQWILTGALRKAWTYSDGSEFVLDFDIRYTDERNFDLVEAAAAPVWVTDESYVLANASAVYRFGADGDYFLSVWGKNLTDELYFGMMQEFGIGTNIAFTGEPRTYGVSAGFSF